MSQRDSDKGTPNEGASITTRASGIKEKKGRRHALKVPVRDEVGYKEALECGFQQEMCSFSDDKGVVGTVSSGAGLGSDSILLKWGRGDTVRFCVIRGRDLFKAWIERFDPESASRLP